MAFDFLTIGHWFDIALIPFYVSMFRARQKLSTKKSTWPTGEFKTKDLWSCNFSRSVEMVLHYSPFQAEENEVQIVRLLQGGCKIYSCLRGQ